MKTKLGFNHTKRACYIAAFSQAIVCGFLPLLFVTFQRDYGILLYLITLLTTLNFVMQLIMDFVSLFFVDRVSYRTTIVTAHGLVTAGMLILGLVVPFVEKIYVYPVILVAVLLFSAGGGIFEVLVSPIVEACPSENKTATMSITHSMFGIGSVAVVIVTNILLAVFGQENWFYIALFWALLPFLNGIYFLFVPINKIVENSERIPMRKLLKRKSFLIFFLLMFCSGATEISMSQWASAFAESSLGIDKVLGDILGPCIFAGMLTISRIVYSRISDRINQHKYLLCCALMSVVFYLCAGLLPFGFAAIISCGLCGFTAGVMWPATLSLAAEHYPTGGVAMFGLFALAGDIGCTLGPTAVGMFSSAIGGELRAGLLVASVFPILTVVGLIMLMKRKKKHS
ncbi:MAG: MFS transporter [Clostridia bacterium]|nr:MFS transporter [Clostridia bacterium]